MSTTRIGSPHYLETREALLQFHTLSYSRLRGSPNEQHQPNTTNQMTLMSRKNILFSAKVICRPLKTRLWLSNQQ